VAAIPNTAVSVNGSTSFCEGNSVMLIAEYNPTYIYQWKLNNNDLINTDTSSYQVKSNSGAYSVKVTNMLANNCAATSSQTTVSINPLPPALEITANGPLEFCKGGKVTLSVPSRTDYTYEWFKDGISQAVFTSSIVDPVYSGLYSVKVGNSHNCKSESTNKIAVKVIEPPEIKVITFSGEPKI